jgi:hypothetical protein
MVKKGGGVFATRDHDTLFSSLPWMAQQAEVATLHQFEAGSRQTNGPVAQVVCLPAGPGWNTPATE